MPQITSKNSLLCCSLVYTVGLGLYISQISRKSNFFSSIAITNKHTQKHTNVNDNLHENSKSGGSNKTQQLLQLLCCCI